MSQRRKKSVESEIIEEEDPELESALNRKTSRGTKFRDLTIEQLENVCKMPLTAEVINDAKKAYAWKVSRKAETKPTDPNGLPTMEGIPV